MLDEGEPFHFAPSGCVAKTLDFRTGQRRASTLQDVREGTALNDELPELDIMWTQVSATDVPLEQRELTEYFTLLTETRKHVTFVDCPTEVDAVVRLCEILAGDLERFRARPRISTVVTAASPLQVDGAILDVHVALARHGVPVKVYSMAVAGATSPVTLAGTVVQGLAEFLGVATVLQVAAPDARLIFCFGSGVLDMRQTTFAHGLRGGRPDGRHGHGGRPPRRRADARARASRRTPGTCTCRAATRRRSRPPRCAPPTPTSSPGWGLLDSHNTMSLPQSVIDNEMAGMLRRLHRPVEVSEATLGGAAIATAGPGGAFLGQKDTAKRIRAGEHYLPTLSSRLSYDKWVEQGVTEYDEACARVEVLLAAHALTRAVPRRRAAGRGRGGLPRGRGERAPDCARLTAQTRGLAAHPLEEGRRMTIRIGYIGLGALGRHLAGSLLKAGFPLTVYDIDRSCAIDLERNGAVCADSIAEMAGASDTVITCLPSPEAVARRRRRARAACSSASPREAPGSR